MEFSKKYLIIKGIVSAILITVAVIGTFLGKDTTQITIMACSSVLVSGGEGCLYFWKAKNENRAKYAQKFVKIFADKYGIDAAIRISEMVLKD